MLGRSLSLVMGWHGMVDEHPLLLGRDCNNASVWDRKRGAFTQRPCSIQPAACPPWCDILPEA